MNSKRFILGIVGMLMLTILCYEIYALSKRIYPTNVPCRPILYDGTELVKTFEPDYYHTDDSIVTISSFYNQHLNPEPGDEEFYFEGDYNVWTMQKVQNVGYIYRCIGRETLGTNVRGCIYVYQQDDHSIIETIMYESSEEVMSCRDTLLP